MTAFLFLVVVVLAIWVARAASRTRRNESLIAQLTSRLFNLEQELKRLRPQASEPAVVAEAEPAFVAAPIPVQPGPVTPFESVMASPEPLAIPEATPEAEAMPASLPPAVPLGKPSFSFRKLPNLEETLGTNWLNKLGIVILVIGVALFLAYEMRELGPFGKVIVGYAISAGMLSAGIFFERREQWRILARTAIGGGWSLVYFTTYAMYHVSAARVLSSEGLDLFLLLLVAAAMVLHTLRYDSQVVTGLAFLLALTTINISRGNVYSLIASAILAAGIVALTLRRHWFEMEIAGIAAAYLNHYLWLRPIIEPMHGHIHTFPGYLASSVLLYGYWLIFRASYVLRRVDEPRAEQVSTIAAILNVGLFLWVMGYQSVHPELAFQFFVIIGAVELILGQLPVTRRRRAAFIVLTTLGVCLLVTAVPYRYSGRKLSAGWLAEAETLLLAGVFLREIVFRRLGLIAAYVLWIQMIVSEAAPLWNDRIYHGARVGRPGLGLLFAIASLFFYFNSEFVPRRWPEIVRDELDRLCFSQLAHLAAVLAAIGAWIAWPGAWTAVAWAALAAALAFAGRRWELSELSLQAPVCAAAAVVRILFVNLRDKTTYPHFFGSSARLLTVSAVIALLYAGSRWIKFPALRTVKRVSGAYTWAGSILAGVLVWYELEPVAVVLGWSIIALLLLETGLRFESTQLRLQAYAGFTASFVRIFFVNLNAASITGAISARAYSIIPLALAFYYVYARLADAPPDSTSLERRLKIAGWHCFFGTLALMALLRFEVEPDLVAAAWAALLLALMAVAWKTDRRIFVYQAVLLAFFVLVRGVFHNIYERSYFPAPFPHGPFVSLGSAIALLFLALPLARTLRQPKPEKTHLKRLVALLEALSRRPDQVCFFVPFVLLTALLAKELPSGMVTLAWGVEAFAVFALALWLKERTYRLSALTLLLLCVLKIVFRDVWGLAPRDRYLTFIVLGSALLAVSYLYTRFREALRQYL